MRPRNAPGRAARVTPRALDGAGSVADRTPASAASVPVGGKAVPRGGVPSCARWWPRPGGRRTAAGDRTGTRGWRTAGWGACRPVARCRTGSRAAVARPALAGMPGGRAATRPAASGVRPGRAGSVAALAAHREYAPRKELHP